MGGGGKSTQGFRLWRFIAVIRAGLFRGLGLGLGDKLSEVFRIRLGILRSNPATLQINSSQKERCLK